MLNKRGCFLVKNKLASLLILIVISNAYTIIAHEEQFLITNPKIETSKQSIKQITISSIAIALLLIYYCGSKKTEKIKYFAFFGITVLTITTTLYLSISTIYLNIQSGTKGPVHWHADFEIWNCGKKLDLNDPKGLSNRIGTPIFHEHNDNRIHVEGTIKNVKNIDLHNFFSTIGGNLEEGKLTIPTNNGIVEINDNDLCNGQKANLQIFLYKTLNSKQSQKTGFIYEQTKLEDYHNYILSPYINVPPGDCIIIEFSEEKEITDKICETYHIAIEKGDMRRG